MKSYYQGDSIGRTIPWPNPTDWEGTQAFDATWSGRWGIMSTIGGAVLTSGTFTRNSSGSALAMNVLPAQTNTLAAGLYYLVCEINNSSIGFSKELPHEQFEIKQQGLS